MQNPRAIHSLIKELYAPQPPANVLHMEIFQGENLTEGDMIGPDL